MFDSVYIRIISRVQKSLGKVLGWTNDPVLDDNINISKYNSLAGSSYLKLPKELDHLKKGLINIQNIDGNKCFQWCLVRYILPAEKNGRRVTKAEKDFARKT